MDNNNKDTNAKIGGFTGGLYNLFDLIGRLFFTILLGKEISERSKLRFQRIIVGAIILFSIIINFILIIKRTDWFLKGNFITSIYLLILFGIFLGIGFGLMVSIILISYVISIEADIEKEILYKKKYQEKYEELIAKGVNSDEADKQANYFAQNKNFCFIATAIYKSENAPEVVFLRYWRDNYLNHFLLGKFFIKFYYIFSPKIVPIVKKSKCIELFFKRIIEKIILTGRKKI